MAFCTQCGATLAGAFCTQCGARAGQAASSATAPAPPAGTPAPPPVPVKRGTSPLVWLLVIVLGIFGIGAMAAIGTGAFFWHKVRQAGVDPEMWRDNPGLAVGRVLSTVNPNLEVVRTDEGAGRVTLRDRRNGKQFSIGIDDARHGRFSLHADEDGKSASIEIGGDARLPSWVPKYPGSDPRPTFSARGESEKGAGEAGNFSFQTPDPASKVMEFYEQQARELELSTRSSGNGRAQTLIVGEEEHDRWLKVVTISGSDETTVNVSYGRKF